MPIKSIIGLLALVSLLISCNQKEKVEANINKYTNVELSISQYSIDRGIERIIQKFKEEIIKPATRDTALIYLPKADSTIEISNKIIKYLENRLNEINKNEELDGNDSLFEKLKEYEIQIMKFDLGDYSKEATLYIDTTHQSFKGINRNQFYYQFLKGANKEQQTTFLKSLESNIKNIEFGMVDYFNRKCSFSIDAFDKMNLMIIQNSTHFKPNDQLEITAGIGAFSAAARPEFIINGISITVDADAAAKYKMRVSNEPGKHIVPIRGSFIKSNGEKAIFYRQLVYHVE